MVFSNEKFIRCRKFPQEIKVIVGTNDLNSGGSQYNVQKLIIHEEYDHLANDIGLLEINGTIEFDGIKVQPIKLSNKFIKEGARLQITGWGRLDVILWRDKNANITVKLI